MGGHHTVACSDIRCDPALLTSLHLVSHLVTSVQSGGEGETEGGLQQRSSPLFVRKQSDELDI